MLFKRLPDTIFGPLASPNRIIYAEVLKHLYAVFIEDVSDDPFPNATLIKDHIQNVLDDMARIVWVDEAEQGTIPIKNNMARSNYIFNRLVDTGWLECEKEGWETHVAMPPDAGNLLSYLVDLERKDRVFLGGMVLGIYNNLAACIKDPENQALALHQAKVETRRFSDYLGSMVYALSNLLKKFASMRSAKPLLATIFDDFIRDFLVADYARLKIQNNPFQHRHKILDLVYKIEASPKLQSRLTMAYTEQMGLPDVLAAQYELDRDLATIRIIFQKIERYLDRIEKHRRRFERRAADAVRYMDQTMPGIVSRLKGILQTLGDTPDEEFEDSRLQPTTLAIQQPISERGIFVPRARRKPAEPRALKQNRIPPKVMAYIQALSIYNRRRSIEPAKIQAYIEHQLEGYTIRSADAFIISNVEDYVAFTHILSLPYLGSEGRRLAALYDITIGDDFIETEWLTCRNFTVQRKARLPVERITHAE